MQQKMKKICINFIICCCLLFGLQQAIAQSKKQHKNWADGQIFVKFNDNIQINYDSYGSFYVENSLLNKELVNKYQITKVSFPFASAKSEILKRTIKIYFNKTDEIEQLIREINNISAVEYAEKVPNFKLFTPPNDPYYNQNVIGNGSIHVDFMGSVMDMGPYDFGNANTSWHLNLINAETAWNLQAGDPNIIVADLDNGIWAQHPDLQNTIVHQFDIADNDNNVTPPVQSYVWSHGTHTAGLIAAENNNGIGISSIGNGISLMAIKIQEDNTEDMSSGVQAIVYAADNGAKIISMSWGAENDGTSAMQTMENAVNYAWNQGCVLLASAGNNGDGSMNAMGGMTTNALIYPAAFQNVIAVGSCDSDDRKSTFSQYGTWVDILAPGGGYVNSGYDMSGTAIGQFTVLSTTYSIATDINVSFSDFSQEGGGASYYGITGNYDIMPGTSMACPIAAGLCGLIWSVNPSFTNAQVRNILESTCDNVDALNPQFIDSIGNGRINAHLAIQTAQSTNQYMVSGNITFNSLPLDNVTISFIGGTTTTDINGNYNFFTVDSSNQNIIPSKIGYYFTPSNISIANIISDTANNNFTATSTYIVSGTVRTESNQPVENVIINYGSETTVTNSNGEYFFTAIEGNVYTITPSLTIASTTYNFTPTNITTAAITGNLPNQDFVTNYLTSVEENDLSKIKIYPNPTQNIITIANCNNADFEIYNILGSKIKFGKINNEQYEINFENLKSGQYLLKIKNNKDLKNIKIIKY